MIQGRVRAPPSKSYTHRALVLATLAEGESMVENPLSSRDTDATLRGCIQFGAKVHLMDEKFRISSEGELSTPTDIVNVENSGTTMRLLTGIATLTPSGYTILTGDGSIRKRPMKPLLDALNALGATCWASTERGVPPIIVKGGRIKGGETKIRGDISSQYISSLIIASLKSSSDTTIRVEGDMVSRPYVDATLKMVSLARGKFEVEGNGYYIPPDQRLKPLKFKIPGDFSSSSFILAAGALAGSTKVLNLDQSFPQADSRFLEILTKMGAEVRVSDNTVVVSRNGKIKGGTFNLRDSPDLLPITSILALDSEEDILIKGVAHTRFKETNRILVLSQELPKLGARVNATADSILIRAPKAIRPAILDCRNDHRMLMAFTVAGLLVSEGIEIKGAESVDVSYPNFIEDMKSIGANIEAKKG